MILQIIKCSIRKNYVKNDFINMLKLSRFQEINYYQFTTLPKQEPNSQISKDSWSQIYKLPIITWAAAFNRLKIYQAGVTTVGIPISYALDSFSIIPDNGAIIFTSVGITGFITLTLGSLVIKNLIGIIYINHKADKLKLSYVDFWGLRKNVELPIDDIIPPYEQPRSKLEFYQTVTTNHENGIKFKLLQRFAQISDSRTFSSIFGE